MARRINPFQPKSPVPTGMFVGRLEEVLRIEQALFQTKAGSQAHILLTGERGIGKTSLLRYTELIARGDIPIDGERLKFLVASIDLDLKVTRSSLVALIERSIDRELGKTEQARTWLKGAWKVLQRVEAAGIKLNPDSPTDDDSLLVDEFAWSIAQTLKRISESSAGEVFNSSYQGILFVFDEADSASDALGLGAFLKSLSEKVSRHGADNFMFLVAGLPGVRECLRRSHESSLRLFDEVELDALSRAEVSRVIDRCIERANELNDEATSVSPGAADLLINFSEGYPHFIQQFGFSAFEKDVDGVIDERDVAEGAFGKTGAIEAIGNRYYRDNFFKKIQSDHYRDVLRIMSKKLDQWVSRQEIKREFNGTDAILANALKALTDRKIVVKKEDQRALYRLQQKGFALWIKLNTSSQAPSSEPTLKRPSLGS